MDRRQRRRQQRPRLCPARQFERSRDNRHLQLHAGRARALPPRRAARRALAGASQLRCRNLRRHERRKRRRGRDGERSMAWTPGIDLAHPAPTCHHRPATHRLGGTAGRRLSWEIGRRKRPPRMSSNQARAGSATFLLDEIDKVVAEAKEAGTAISAKTSAEILSNAYPNSGISVARIVEELITEATEARVLISRC